MEANGGGESAGNEKPTESWDPPELEEWELEDLPKIWNAESLDQVELAPTQLLALRFRGGGIGLRGVNLRLFALLIESVNRMLTGLQPIAAGLQVGLGGPPPKLPGIEPPLLQGAGVGQSITLVLALAGDEARILGSAANAEEALIDLERSKLPDASELPSRSEFERIDDESLAAEFPTLKAAGWMAQLLSAPAEEATREVHRLGRRATRDYLMMTEVLAKNEIDTFVRRPRGGQVELPSGRAFVQAREIRRREQRVPKPMRIRGALYQADAKNHRFRIITDAGEAISGTYLPEMIDEVRGAWAKIVEVEIIKYEFHWVEDDQPHRTTYELQEVLGVFEDADARLREIEAP